MTISWDRDAIVLVDCDDGLVHRLLTFTRSKKRAEVDAYVQRYAESGKVSHARSICDGGGIMDDYHAKVLRRSRGARGPTCLACAAGWWI